MDTSTPRCTCSLSETEGKGRPENQVFVLWGAVQTPCGSGLEHLWGGVIVWKAFFADGVWTEATPRGGGLGWNFH